MTTLSIDPALHGCGCAFFDNDGVLKAAAYVQNDCPTEKDIVTRCTRAARLVQNWAGSPDELVVELPQIYQRGANKTKGDPNKNVLPLAMINAALAAFLSTAWVYSYQPHVWKGSTQKPDTVKEKYVIHARVMERLSSEEQSVISWPKSIERGWDVVDAVAIGMFHLGRFQRKRVFARD